MNHLRRLALAGALTAAVGAAPAAFAQGVSPVSVSGNVNPGQTIHVSKTVATPVVPPKPDVVLLVDTTGSMDGAIADVQSGMSTIISTVRGAQPDAQFAITQYRDVGEPLTFDVASALTSDDTTTTTAINGLVAAGGGDGPEAQINALYQLGSGGNAIAYRADSSRIVVWFGDASGHDPSNGHTLSDAITSVTDVGATVIAIDITTPFNDGLDAAGQATAVTTATGGPLFSGVDPGAVAASILNGLQNLPVEISASPTCDAGLSVTLTPATQTVASGTNAVFDEAITVAADAPQGANLSCTTAFLVGGLDAGPEFTQTISITVNDITPPTAKCGPGVNPAGHTPPGYARAGFYSLIAHDNLPGVMVTVTDPVSGAVFGPYAPGTMIHLTQAPGATPTATAGPGQVDWRITLQGDALVTATDAIGNTTSVTCSVPPDRK